MLFDDPATARLCDVLKWRRDVRHFKRDPLPDDVLDRLRAVMELAPSVGNARPWRVLQVQSQDKRDGIVRIFEECNAKASERYDGEKRSDYMALKLAGLREAPVHLAVYTVIDPDEGHGLGRQTMPEMLAYSTAMAIHTLWLAARAENVGMGWVSILDPVAVSQCLGVPQDWKLTGYLCLGYPEKLDDTPLLHRAGWQENTATLWDTV